MNCGTCKFFHAVPKPADVPDEEREKLPNVGQCRVRAPTVGFAAVPKLDLKTGGMMPVIERGTSFPQVLAEVWCGEWAAKG